MPEIGSIVIGLLCLSLLFFEHPTSEQRGRFNLYLWTIAGMVCIFGWVVLWKASTLTDYASYLPNETKTDTTQVQMQAQLLFATNTEAFFANGNEIKSIDLLTGLQKNKIGLGEHLISAVTYIQANTDEVRMIGICRTENPQKHPYLITFKKDLSAHTIQKLQQVEDVQDVVGSMNSTLQFPDSGSLTFLNPYEWNASDGANKNAIGMLTSGKELYFQYPTLKMPVDTASGVPKIKTGYPIVENGQQKHVVVWEVHEYESWLGNEGIVVLGNQTIKIKARNHNGWVSQITLHEMNGQAIDTLYFESFNHFPVLATDFEFILLSKDFKRHIRLDRKTFARLDNPGFVNNISERLAGGDERNIKLELGIWILLFGLVAGGLFALPKKSPLHSTNAMKQYALIYMAIAVPAALFFMKVIVGF